MKREVEVFWGEISKGSWLLDTRAVTFEDFKNQLSLISQEAVNIFDTLINGIGTLNANQCIELSKIWAFKDSIVENKKQINLDQWRLFRKNLSPATIFPITMEFRKI